MKAAVFYEPHQPIPVEDLDLAGRIGARCG